MFLKKIIKKAFRLLGYDITNHRAALPDENAISQKLLFKLVCECLAFRGKYYLMLELTFCSYPKILILECIGGKNRNKFVQKLQFLNSLIIGTNI
jgi:hypothetical protein